MREMGLRLAVLSCVFLSFIATSTPLTLEDLSRVRQVVQAEMAPDGDKIAFTITKPRVPLLDDFGDNWRELYLINKRGKLRPFLTGHDAIGQIQWDSGSDVVWFQAKRQKDEYISLYQIKTDGGEASRVLDYPNNILGFALAPDDKGLLFWAAEAEPPSHEQAGKLGINARVFNEDTPRHQLWLANTDDESMTVTNVPGDQHVLAARWLASSSNIVLQSAPSAKADDVVMRKSLQVISPDGEVLKHIPHSGKMGDFRVSPDGKHIAFIGTNDPKDPAEGRLLIARLRDLQVWDALPDFKGHIQDIAWLNEEKVAFVAHMGTDAIVGRKSIGNRDADYIPVVRHAGIIERISVDRDGREYAMVVNTPEHPDELFWRNRRASHRVTNSNPWLDDKTLAKQSAVTYPARDGTEIEGILVSPLKSPSGPAPLLLFVHGGPENHVSNGWISRYSYPAQVAAANGYRVFLPNYRGSTGRGVAFSQLGQEDYAGAEFNDLLDAKAYLVKRGLADPARTGISGTSYGGYAAAWGATRLTEHFRAAVSGMGIANQVSKFGTTDIPTEMQQLHAQIWPWDDWQTLLQRSPVYYANQSKTPLLLLHGLDDKRVHHSQSMELYQYIRAATDTPVRLVLYPEAGHGFSREMDKLDYSRRLMRWMDHFVKGDEKNLPPMAIFSEEEIHSRDDKTAPPAG